MPLRTIYINLAALGLLIVLLGLVYWQHTGARAVPGLIEDMQSQDLQTQLLAVQWLAKLGEDARPAVPVLLEQALHHPHPSMNAAAVSALRVLDLRAAREVMATTLSALRASTAEVRRNACAVLGSLGLLAKPTVPSLIAMLGDEDDLVRERAVAAIGSIGLPASDVAAALTSALFDRSPMVRHRAVSLFAFAVPIPTAALAPLAGLQKDPDKTVAALARIALDRGGGVHRIDVQILMARLQRRDDREDALQRLARLGPPAAEAVPAIIRILNDRLPLHRYLAAEALGAIGPAAAQALPALRQILADQDPVVRQAVADALRSIESAPLTSGGTP